MKTTARRATKFVMFGLMAIVAFALFGFIVMWLWNWVVPPVIGWHTVTYWQAIALLILGHLLFGGFRGGHRGRGHWRRRMHEKWERMTPEERQKFREAMMERWGCIPPDRMESKSPQV